MAGKDVQSVRVEQVKSLFDSLSREERRQVALHLLQPTVAESGPEPVEPWLTAEEAALHAGVPVETLRRWAREGRVEHGRAGREYRFRADALDQYLRRQVATPVDRGEEMSPRVLEILGKGVG